MQLKNIFLWTFLFAFVARNHITAYLEKCGDSVKEQWMRNSRVFEYAWRDGYRCHVYNDTYVRCLVANVSYPFGDTSCSQEVFGDYFGYFTGSVPHSPPDDSMLLEYKVMGKFLLQYSTWALPMYYTDDRSKGMGELFDESHAEGADRFCSDSSFATPQCFAYEYDGHECAWCMQETPCDASKFAVIDMETRLYNPSQMYQFVMCLYYRYRQYVPEPGLMKHPHP